MAVNIALFGAFLLMVAVFGFFLWQTLFASEKYGVREPQSKPAYAEQQSGHEQPAGSGPAPSATKSTTDEAIADYTKWLAIFTMFLVLATLGLFISGERNVGVARKSAVAAEDAARAAQDSVEATKTIMRLDQRAWIGIDSMDAVPAILEVGKSIGMTGVIKNTGKTPARNIVMYSIIEVVYDGKPPNFSYDGIKKAIGGFLPPNGQGILPLNTIPDLKTNQPVILTQEQLDLLKSRKADIYSHGRIEYDDIFGAHHWMTYCSYLQATLGGFAFCAEHNETDDYQEAKK